MGNLNLNTLKTPITVGVLLIIRLLLGLILDGDTMHILFFYIDMVMIYSIAAIGLGLLTGYAGQISLGNSSFFAIGAFISAVLTIKLALPFWISFIIAGVVGAVFGFLLGLPALRLSGHYLAIATLGFGIAIPQILNMWEGFSGGSSGLKPPAPSFFGVSLKAEEDFFFVILAVLVLLTIASVNLVNSRTGRAFVSVRDSEIAAQAMGINLSRYKTMAFASSAFYAGVAGALYGHFTHFISATDFSLQLSLDLLTMITIGGLASIPGAIIGATFLTLIKPVIDMLSSGFPEAIKNVAQTLPQVLTGVVLILVVLYLPSGLISLWRRLYANILKAKEGGGKGVSFRN